MLVKPGVFPVTEDAEGPVEMGKEGQLPRCRELQQKQNSLRDLLRG